MSWIKCSDQMPEQKVAVICFTPAGDGFDDSILLGEWNEFEGEVVWWCVCRSSSEFKPTHWMSFPEKPHEMD